jgi:hypothetical protein
MIQDKDIIYVNGDSFTAGTDIVDHTLPGYPAEQSLHDLVENHNPQRSIDYHNWRYNLLNKNPDTVYIQELEKQRRWSSKLSSIIGKPIINNSYAGSDNFSIFTRTCSDVEKLRQKGYTVSKIIIQLTGFMRYSYIRNIETSSDDAFRLDLTHMKQMELAEGFFFRHVMPIQMGSDRITPQENEFLKRSLYEELIYDDQSNSSKFIGNLLNLKLYKDAVTGATGIEPIIVDSMFIKTYLHWTGSSEYLKNKDSYASRLFRSIFSDQIESMFDIPDFNEKSLTGGNHFVESVHTKFAERLATRYFNE